MENEFYKNKVLLEIFLQNFIPAFNQLETDKAGQCNESTKINYSESQDYMIIILKNVVGHLMESEGDGYYLFDDLWGILEYFKWV